MLLPQLVKTHANEVRLLVACMPKSGSTFLSTLLSQFPGMRREHLVPGYKRREQEICLNALGNAIYNTKHLRYLKSNGTLDMDKFPRGFVAQMHLRFTEPTLEILREYDLKVVVLVRNLADALVSMRDHIKRASNYAAMGYVTEEMRQWEDARLEEFIVDMIAPWYIHFYVSWTKAECFPIFRYEDLAADPARVLRSVAAEVGLPRSQSVLDEIVASVQKMNTRQNKGVAGRGQELAPPLLERIRHMRSYYPDVDFTPIGL